MARVAPAIHIEASTNRSLEPFVAQERSAIIGHKSTTGGVGDIAARLAEMLLGICLRQIQTNHISSPFASQDPKPLASGHARSRGPEAEVSCPSS